MVKKNRTKVPLPMMLRLLRRAITLLNALSPALAGRLVSRIWFGAQRHKEPAREARWRASAQQVWLRPDPQQPDQQQPDQQLAVYVWGQQGPSVLLLHGWSGRGTQMGAFAEPLQQAGYRVLAFDAPAHGRSSGRSTHIFQIIDALWAVNSEYGPFHGVITHSFGSMVLARALRDGLQTERVVCISPPAQLRFLIDSFCETLQVPLAARQNFQARLEARFGKDIYSSISAENNVRELSIPALIIHDEDDRDVPLEQGRRLLEAWPGARLETTRGLGHRRILRDADTIQKAVDYIRRA